MEIVQESKYGKHDETGFSSCRYFSEHTEVKMLSSDRSITKIWHRKYKYSHLNYIQGVLNRLSVQGLLVLKVWYHKVNAVLNSLGGIQKGNGM